MTNHQDKVLYIFFIIIAVAIIGGILNIPIEITNQIIQWLTSVLISVILSVIAGTIVEAFTGDFLKSISFTFPIIDGISISFTLFAVATFVVKFWLFGL